MNGLAQTIFSGLRTLLVPLTLLATGCTLGPDYQRPPSVVPADYRWKAAEPRDAAPKGPWWEMYGDASLNRLQENALANNQTLKAAFARVDQARARARVSKADFFPTLTSSPSWQRYRTSSTTASNNGFPAQAITANDFSLPIDLSYEIDLWGKVRRAFESNRAGLLASAAAYQHVLFTLQADVAVAYYNLRALDHEIDILRQAIRLREESVVIFEKRYTSGLSSELDATRARSELATARADLAAAELRRSTQESTLAILCGQPAATFEIAPELTPLVPPPVSPGLPSELLERRPDVAEAERTLAARNADIGVAQAAFFPSIRLTAGGGLQSAELSDLFMWESRIWSFGPQITLPIFSGGRNKAALDEARAAYEEAVANYRQAILVAFQEVDDALAGGRFLAEQSNALRLAVESSRKSAGLSITRYNNGVVDYLDVIDAERTRLQNELQAVRVDGERMTTSVLLVKAIGGGWPSATPPETLP
jgi:multidrug efflux system outer membrane protein